MKKYISSMLAVCSLIVVFAIGGCNSNKDVIIYGTDSDTPYYCDVIVTSLPSIEPLYLDIPIVSNIELSEASNITFYSETNEVPITVNTMNIKLNVIRDDNMQLIQTPDYRYTLHLQCSLYGINSEINVDKIEVTIDGTKFNFKVDITFRYEDIDWTYHPQTFLGGVEEQRDEYTLLRYSINVGNYSAKINNLNFIALPVSFESVLIGEGYDTFEGFVPLTDKFELLPEKEYNIYVLIKNENIPTSYFLISTTLSCNVTVNGVTDLVWYSDIASYGSSFISRIDLSSPNAIIQ